LGRNTDEAMKKRILQQAKEDIPLYFGDFKAFWDTTNGEIKDDDLFPLYRATLVFKNWKIVFKALAINQVDQILDELYEDINSAFFLSLYGLYRSSHLHMRSSIELTLQLLYFLHHPIEFDKWQRGDFVIKHRELIEYLNEHPRLSTDVKDLLLSISRDWKFFSKNIHGEAPIFFQCEKKSKRTGSFSLADFNKWKSSFLSNIYKLNKLLILFFKNDLPRFPEASRNLLLDILSSEDREQLT
jgi:hypothetical protein